MKALNISILLLFIISIFSVQSTNYYRAINYSEGLSHLNVKSIYQDSLGFMWFGTKNRLNKFDGVSIKAFDCFDKDKGKQDNSINAIRESSGYKLWLGTDNGVFIYDMQNETFHFFDKETTGGHSVQQWVADICVDRAGHVWIVVPNQGLFKYDTVRHVLTLYNVVDHFVLGRNHPGCITMDEDGRIWVGTNGSGVYLYDDETDTFEQYQGNKGAETLEHKNIYTIAVYKNQIILGIHEECLMLLHPLTNRVETIHIPSIDYSIIRYIAVYDSVLWVATQNGLYSVELQGKNIITQNVTSYTLVDKFIEYVYKDKEGGLWIGTKFGGINLLPNHGDMFEVHSPKAQNLFDISNRMKEIIEDESGNLWIGTEDSGILKFDPSTGLFESIKTTRGNKQVLSLMQKDKEIWAGYFKGGIDIISMRTGKVEHHVMAGVDIYEKSLFTLAEDKDGHIWTGDGWNIFRQKKGETKFTLMEAFDTCYAFDIYQDTEGYIWFATIGSGILRYNPEDESVRQFTVGTGEGLTTNLINGVSEDYKGQLWFSTDRGGICVYNKKSDAFKTYSMTEGLPDDMTYKILEDQNHNIWFGTNKGLVCLNPASDEIRLYTEKDGLPSNSFNYNSALVSKTGKLYMGTMEGLVSFNPENFRKNEFVPPIYITEFLVSGSAVTPHSEPVKINSSISLLDEIQLNYKQSNIRIRFASLSYTSPNSNLYAYILDGVDQNWTYTKENLTASYANLKPGIYQFRVRGTNNDGVWNNDEKVLKIKISPPWWQSKAAYFVYFVLAVLGIYVIVSQALKKYHKRSQIRQRLFEVRKEKELYEAKLNFFTEIAHEIRTPVTLISGPLDSIMQEEFKNSKINSNLQIIRKNTHILLDLINQLLDYRKVDSKKFIVNMNQLDIIELTDNILDRFGEKIKSHNITCRIDKHNHDTLPVYADKEAVDKIMTNLLSNAIKYCDGQIDISFDVGGEYVKIEVSNDGELIPVKVRDKIFDPFFRVKDANSDIPGSGLGLSLAKSLAEILNGYLYYNSEGDRNNFYLKIPIRNDIVCTGEAGHDDPAPEEMEQTSALLHNLLDLPEQKKSVLIVEDNPDMLEFIKNELSVYFDIQTAKNGEEAIHVLNGKNFDIVISDIMMPVMNGYELCSAIKNNPKFEHIIVILLTARNDVESKIYALNMGAEAYVEKPFSIKYIVTLIDSLERNRQTTINKFIKNPSFGMQHNNALSKTDQAFLEKVIDIINSNIADANFNVEKLAELLNYSRSSLHRKIKSIIDVTPIDLIRLVRLHKAVELIKQDEYRISEISYLVGINSPSYFVKLFQSQYNLTPKEYKDSLKKN